MNPNEIKWQNLCKIQKSLFGQSEQNVQSVWETIFSEIFGYSRLENEIDSHRIMRLGSTDRLIPDIIIKNQSKDLFVVELKQANLVKDDSYELQLISYLKQLHAKVGILICDRIVLIDYDYNKPDNDQIDFDIQFDPENEDGIAFVELFSKETFSFEKVKDFIDLKTRSHRNETAIRKELTVGLIDDLLGNYFSTKYPNEDYKKVRESINIHIDTGNNGIEIRTENKTPIERFQSSRVSDLSRKLVVLSKPQGIELCRSNGFSVSKNCTWASENKTTHQFWSNPSVESLFNDWWLLLNDVSRNKIYVLFIPANSIKKEQLRLRTDNSLKLDIRIRYNDNSFTDELSKLQFGNWFKKTIEY